MLRQNSSSAGHDVPSTALTSMCLDYCSLDPGFLQHSTQLQSLQLKWVTLTSGSGSVDSPADSAMLLSCVARMTNLEQLSLSLMYSGWTSDLMAYTALTASSRLQELELSDDTFLPHGIWQAAFPAARICPQLQVGV